GVDDVGGGGRVRPHGGGVHGTHADQRKHFQQHHRGHHDAQRQVTHEALAQLLLVDVEHHHHEQEQHHDRTHVDHHQRDGEKFGLHQQPQAGHAEEGHHQRQYRVHGIAQADHHQRAAHGND